MSEENNKYAVLFVCLGNICRSPLAEGVLKHLTKERKVEDCFIIDSAGIGPWHKGELPHRESIKVAKKHGIKIEEQRARQICAEDFLKFDLIVAMDRKNKADLEGLKIGSRATICLIREFDRLEDGLDVPDPFFGPVDGFQRVYEMIYRCCDVLLLQLCDRLKIGSA